MHVRFHDNITEFWDAELVAGHVRPFLKEHDIDIVRHVPNIPLHHSFRIGLLLYAHLYQYLASYRS